MSANGQEPQIGDLWHVKRPRGRAIIKEIAGFQTLPDVGPWVIWKRVPGRMPSGITMDALLSFGYRISTFEQRQARIAHLDAMHRRARERRIARGV